MHRVNSRGMLPHYGPLDTIVGGVRAPPPTPLRCVNRHQSRLNGDGYLQPALPVCWLAAFFPVYIRHSIQLFVNFFLAPLEAKLQVNCGLNTGKNFKHWAEPVSYLKHNRVNQLQRLVSESWPQITSVKKIAPQDKVESSTSTFSVIKQANI